jgi:RNA polymerase sigma factor (sigma-70 family)
MSEKQKDDLTSTDQEPVSDTLLMNYALQSARFFIHRMKLPNDLAEDIAQDAVLKYHQFGKRQQQIKNRRAYVHSIVKNQILDHLRHEAGGHYVSLEPSETQQTPLVAEPTVAAQAIESRILVHEIWRHLDQSDRTLFELLMLGYRGNELAHRLMISSAAARQRTRRLITKIKPFLTGKLESV